MSDMLLAFCAEHKIDLHCAEPMARHTTFRAGGYAAWYSAPETREKLVKLISFSASQTIELCVIGNGSNLLVPDEGYDGLVIRTMPALDTIEWVADTTLRAGAGALLSNVSAAAAARGMTGLEFAQGIPGTVGGAVFINAGAYGGEICQVLAQSECLLADGNIVVLPAAQHEFGYRTSVYKRDTSTTVMSADFTLQKGDPEKIRARMGELAASRREKQPLEFPSAGSAFKRPEGYFAGKLIEDSGLKGYAIGGAQVSEKHSGFVINRGGATASDILRLLDHIEETVYRRFGVTLEREIQILR